jgi:hypothetical protein
MCFFLFTLLRTFQAKRKGNFLMTYFLIFHSPLRFRSSSGRSFRKSDKTDFGEIRSSPAGAFFFIKLLTFSL